MGTIGAPLTIECLTTWCRKAKIGPTFGAIRRGRSLQRPYAGTPNSVSQPDIEAGTFLRTAHLRRPECSTLFFYPSVLGCLD